MPSDKQVLIVGDPADGFTFYGPLPRGEEIDLHARDLPDQDRWLADLNALPNGAEEELQATPSEVVVGVPRGELNASLALACKALCNATHNASEVTGLCEALERWARDHE
jgi:hypothetical protein